MKLLVPLDGSRLAEQAVAHAAGFSRRFEAELHLLHVIENESRDPDKPFDCLDWELRCAGVSSYLAEVQRSLAARQIVAQYHVAEGSPALEIVEFCHRYEIDLLVLSAYGSGGQTQFPRGGTVQKVVSGVDVSLLLVGTGATPETEGVARYRRILVSVDDSPRAEWALHQAAVIAQAHGAELSLLRVVQEPKVSRGVLETAEGRRIQQRFIELNRLDASRRLEELKALLPRNPPATTRLIVAPEVAPVIEDVARSEEADLLVLSAHELSSDDYWLYGPVAETVLAHTTRSVLILQDASERGFTLKPISRVPARSARADLKPRAEAS